MPLFSRKLFFVCSLLLLSRAHVALAHGIGYREIKQKPMVFEFFYATGEPMSYRDAKVFSPQDEKIAYQSGRTDASGRFAFTPNTQGDWNIIVKDEEGHLVKATIAVTQEADTPASFSSLPEGREFFVRAVLGLSLLLNIAALGLLAHNKKKRPT